MVAIWIIFLLALFAAAAASLCGEWVISSLCGAFAGMWLKVIVAMLRDGRP